MVVLKWQSIPSASVNARALVPTEVRGKADLNRDKILFNCDKKMEMRGGQILCLGTFVQLIGLLLASGSFHIFEPESDGTTAKVGGSATLNCQASQNYDSCRWEKGETGKLMNLVATLERR